THSKPEQNSSAPAWHIHSRTCGGTFKSGWQASRQGVHVLSVGHESRATDGPVSPEIRKAVELLKHGRLVAFPTETVYGLGADASNAQAVARLYAVKRRPGDHPVIVHFDGAERAFTWARDVPESARTLAKRFWPGPLTLILKRSALAK